MTTIVLGDVAEGAKYRSEADFMKRELARQHRQNNSFMQVWKDLPGGARIHVRMVSGMPTAFIYSGQEGYAFYVPITLVNLLSFTYVGQGFFEGLKDGEKGSVVGAFEGTNLNCWYSKSELALVASLGRYAQTKNLSILPGEQPFVYSKASFAFVAHGPRSYHVWPNLHANAASTKGNYVFAIANFDTPNPTYAKVLDRSSSAVVYAAELTGSWTIDATKKVKTPYGNWYFNREGTKACVVAHVEEYPRFSQHDPFAHHIANPSSEGVTSYVLEIEFLLDSEGVFAGVQGLQLIETPDFCIAADYDWTTVGNELITAQLVGTDYRFEKSTLWSPSTSINTLPVTGRQWVVGDHIKTQLPALYDDLTKSRPGNIYEIVGITHPPLYGPDITGTATEWTAVTPAPMGSIFKVTQTPAPAPPEIPFTHYYVVTAVPIDPDPENPPPAEDPVTGASAPSHTIGSAQNGNVTLLAISPITGADRTLFGVADEWAANSGGMVLGDTLKVTQTTPPEAPELPTVRYYEVVGIPTTPPENPDPPLTGGSPPTHYTGVALNGNVTLAAVDAKWPTHQRGTRINGNLICKPLVRGEAREWTANATQYDPTEGEAGQPLSIAVGDLVKVTPPYTADGRPRELRYYEVVSIPSPPPPIPQFGPSAPVHTIGVVTNGNVGLMATTDIKTATDVWMHLRYADGTILKSLELAHNADPYETTSSATGTWYEKDPNDISFVTNITGMDLRVRGVTAYSESNGSVWATMYDREWTNGVDLPTSGATALPLSNYYMPDPLSQRIKNRLVAQTMAVVPYLSDAGGKITDACVYAPYITDIGKAGESADPNKAIDFRINKIDDTDNRTLWETIEDGKGMVKHYHRGVYENYFPGVAPYLNRYFLSGSWEKKKGRE